MTPQPSLYRFFPLLAGLSLACATEQPNTMSLDTDGPLPDETVPLEPGTAALQSPGAPQAVPGWEKDCLICDDDRDECLLECDADREHCIVTCEECSPTEEECAPVPDCVQKCESTHGGCLPRCDEDFGDCWEANDCDDLDQDCEECLQDCHTKCQEEPEDQVGNCISACESFQDHCWASLECDGPYSDVTAVCNYLDRGINDFQTGQIDFYEVVPPGVATLADIQKLEFGLDMPGTNCATGNAIPCVDKDYATKWSFDEIAMLVGGVPFFHAQKGPDDPWLRLIGGGTKDGGIAGWDYGELTANPFWGLSEQEILTFYSELPLINGLALPALDDVKMGIPPVTVSAPRLSAMVEGIIGQVLSQSIKTGAGSESACAGQIYCDNARDYQAAWRGTYHNGSPDCDLGDCPASAERKSSPWLELRGDHNRLTVNADLEVLEGKADPTDCPDGGLLCGNPNGTKYKWLADIGLQLELRAVCSDAPGGTKSIRLALGEVDITLEDGNTLVKLAEDHIMQRLDGTMSEVIVQSWQAQTLIDGLEACPESFAVFDLDGALSFEMDTKGVCMPNDYLPEVEDCSVEPCPNGFGCVEDQCVPGAGGTPARDCAGPDDCVSGTDCTVGTGRSMDPTQFVRWARLRSQPPGSARSALEAAYEQHVATIPVSTAWAPSIADDIAGPALPGTKVPFSALTAIEAPLCALTTGWTTGTPADDNVEYHSTCAPDIDVSAIEIPPPNVPGGGLPFTCDPEIGPGDAANEAACSQLAQIKAFLMQPEVYDKCLLHHLPPAIPPDDALIEQVWDAFQVVVGQCEEEVLPFESFIPVPGLDLTLLTGTFPGSDTFPFVDVTHADQLRESVHAGKKCRNRIDLDPIDPYTYPDCTDADDNSLFGLEGCPCADIDILDFEDILNDGGYPDGAGSHSEHGLSGTSQYCENDGGDELVCGRIQHQGRDFPVCMRCHEDTKVGCDCQANADCSGIEDGLVCVGSSTEEGWIGGVVGQCLPDPGVLSGQEELEEMRWFCLDNCDSIDGNGGEVGACYFNQHTAFVDHGTCINTLNECGSPSPGICEEDGNVCRENNEGGEVCEPECDASTDCSNLGFPAHFVCDDFSPGHCVPAACAGNNELSSFCELYR